MEVIKKLFFYVSRYRLSLNILVLVSLFGVALEVLKPLPIKIIVDNVLSNDPVPQLLQSILGHEFSESKTNLLILLISLMIFVVIGSALLSALIFNLTINLSQRLVYDLSIDFFSKLQRLSLTFHARNRIGDLLNRINGDVFIVYFLVAQIILPAFTSVVCLIGMFYVMIKIDFILALVAFSVVPLLGLTLAFFAKPMNDTTIAQYTSHGQFSAFVQQALSSMKVIQAFGRESFMFQKMKTHALEFSNAYKKANKVAMTHNQLSIFITGLASALVIGIGAYRSLDGKLSTGDLFIFVGYISALSGPVNSLTTAISTAVTISARGKRIFDILDSNEIVKEKSGALDIEHCKGAVEFLNVTFGYGDPGRSPILNGISFSVQPGDIVALVGPTGAGKTSIISLLTRFYDPWHGNVLIDGIDIKDLQLHSLRKNISIVLQDSFLFPMSISDNILFGNPYVTYDQVVEAAKAAQAHDFIEQLPEGYETIISENGASLSGGQRQRIAIARAFLKKAPILILDEPTSAVDALTEAKIFKALEERSKGKTVIVITHRLSTIKHANQIIAIRDGHVVEKGTHESLLAENKFYANLYKYQHIT